MSNAPDEPGTDGALRDVPQELPPMNAAGPTAKELFLAALRLPPDDWPAFLADGCGPDPDLAHRVGDLLRAHRDAAGQSQAPGAGATVPGLAGEGPGTVIGPYKLLEQIGEGGFGVVFMAEQTQTVRRKVALKVLKPGMDTAQVIARFESERQALALMDHPHIAKVLDAGATESGRPHCVM